MKKYQRMYHGSPAKGLKILKPHFDRRLKIKAVFLSDEIFGPMIFSLLKERHSSTVEYTTRRGKFITGKVITKKPLLKSGWLYTFKVEKKALYKKPRPHLKTSTPVLLVKKVTRKETLKLGWNIILKK